MNKYDIILFDLDGTISNSKEGITNCVQYALSKFGIEELDLDALEHFIGPPLRDEFKRAYGFTADEAEKATAIYRERYEPVGIYEAYMYPGIAELLKFLKENGKIIGLATSKPQDMAEEVLKYFNILEYFDYVMGAERVGPRQSKTDVLLELFKEMGVSEDKSSIVLIGDTCFDVQGAVNVGIDCIGVGYGFGNGQDMLDAGAVLIAEDAKELINILGEV